MESLDPILLISRWLHLAAAIIALGGAFFVRLALLPGARETLPATDEQKLRDAVRKRWAPLVHASIAVLLLTGFFNFYWMAIRPKVPPMPYHAVFGVKLLAALFIFFVAEALVGKGPGFSKMRERRAGWLTVILITGGVVILISGALNQLRSSSLPRETATRTLP
jgi:uncharacterized membrane protein